jgi:hypothetical protein
MADENDDKDVGVGENQDTGSKEGGGEKLAGGEPEKYEVKIDGETRLLTLDELKTYATKSAGADKLMRDAAAIRKDSQEGVRVKDLFDKVLHSDDVTATDIRELAVVMGIDPDEMEGVFNEELGKLGDRGGGGAQAPPKIGREQLDDEMRAIFDQTKADQITAAERKVFEMCKEGVDKDDFFGKILKEVPKEELDDKKDAITRMVNRDVRLKIIASPYTGEKFGADMIQGSIQTIRSELKKYGIPSKSTKQSAISNILAALGPTGGLPAEVQSDEKIERVPSTEPGYEDNVVKRLGQKMVQSITSRLK